MIKNLLFTPFVAVLLFTSCGSDTPSDEKQEQTTASQAQESSNDHQSGQVYWKGSMQGMYDHEGTIDFKNVDFHIENGKLISGKFAVDMSTIEPTDANYVEAEGKTREKLVEHLSSEDFFDIANFPTATFEVIPNNEMKGLSGNLTIKGVTKEILIKEIRVSEDGKSMKARFNIDRTDFGVSFKHPMKEMILSNDIELRVVIKDI